MTSSVGLRVHRTADPGKLGMLQEQIMFLAAFGIGLMERQEQIQAHWEDGNVLCQLRSRYGRCDRAGSSKRAEMPAALIALGVPLQACDGIGWTPLMGCNDHAMAQTPLKARTDPNAKDRKGTTVVLSVLFVGST